jgi:hypothetical protein
MPARHLAHLTGLLCCCIVITTAIAGTEKVGYPADYSKKFVRYAVVDAPGPKRVRTFYAIPEAIRDAKPRQPLPDGTVLVMEVREAQRDSSGEPIRDADGRFMPSEKIVGLWVQEKKAGWGAEYSDSVRNGEWEYARFNEDGSRVKDADLGRCFACHKSRGARDFTFLFWKLIADRGSAQTGTPGAK